MMRFIITFIFSILLNLSYGQTKDSTFFASMAKDYLSTMYVKKKIDSAFIKLDTTKIIETYFHNYKSAKKNETPSNTLAKIKKDFSSYVQNIINFNLKDNFQIDSVQIDRNFQQTFLTYYYTDSTVNPTVDSQRILIFRSNDFGTSWKIVDLRLIVH